MSGIRSIVAPNPGQFTLEGTHTYLLGVDPVVIVDPGPDDESHVQRVAAATNGGPAVILLTHAHPDHAAGAPRLGSLLDLPVRGPGGDEPILDGDTVEAGGLGSLVAVSTPGHSREHYCFHIPGHGAVLVGDMLLGRGNTTWIGEYPNGVRDYLASLDVIEGLGASVLYPAHGDPITDVVERIDLFRQHRLSRIEEVREALKSLGDVTADEFISTIYPGLDPDLRPAATMSIQAILDYLQGEE